MKEIQQKPTSILGAGGRGPADPPPSSRIISPPSAEVSRDQRGTGCCVCSLLKAECQTSQAMLPLTTGCDVQYTVTVVTWNNTLGRWHGLMLMANSSTSLLESCSLIVMCPRKTASNSAFLWTLCCGSTQMTFTLVITSRVTVGIHENNSRLLSL